MMAEAKEVITAYTDTKNVAKYAIWLAKSDSDGVFRIAKRMKSTGQNIVSESCVRNYTDEHALTDGDKKKAWVKHYARLLNSSLRPLQLQTRYVGSQQHHIQYFSNRLTYMHDNFLQSFTEVLLHECPESSPQTLVGVTDLVILCQLQIG